MTTDEYKKLAAAIDVLEASAMNYGISVAIPAPGHEVDREDLRTQRRKVYDLLDELTFGEGF